MAIYWREGGFFLGIHHPGVNRIRQIGYVICVWWNEMGCFWGVHAIECFQVERIAHADDRLLSVLIVNKINLCTNVYCTINSDVNGNVCVCVFDCGFRSTSIAI